MTTSTPASTTWAFDQAEAMAAGLAPLGPLPMVVSPRRRTRETAAALEKLWGVISRVDPRVGEIATPDGVGLADRGTWLRDLMARRWPELSHDLQVWRQDVLDGLWALDADTVVVTHFVAINVAVGWATGDDRVVNVSPDNCSVTALERVSGSERLALVSL
jgi:broad specificity phosphatase PhoE